MILIFTMVKYCEVLMKKTIGLQSIYVTCTCLKVLYVCEGDSPISSVHFFDINYVIYTVLYVQQLQGPQTSS